jgi:hypothetical protein
VLVDDSKVTARAVRSSACCRAHPVVANSPRHEP